MLSEKGEWWNSFKCFTFWATIITSRKNVKSLQIYNPKEFRCIQHSISLLLTALENIFMTLSFHSISNWRNLFVTFSRTFYFKLFLITSNESSTKRWDYWNSIGLITFIFFYNVYFELFGTTQGKFVSPSDYKACQIISSRVGKSRRRRSKVIACRTLCNL